jgi:signal transduction histidine kinase
MRSAIERLRPRSLRQRLIVWYSLLVVALFVALSVATYAIQAHVLADSARASVDRERAIVRAALQNNLTTTPPYWPTTVNIPEIDAYTAPGITIGVVDDQAHVRYQSADVGSVVRLPLGNAMRSVLMQGQSVLLQTTIEGQPTLVALDPVFAGTHQVIGVTYVARSQADINTTLGNLRWLLFGATLVALAMALGGGYLLTRRALEPLAMIARTAAKITQGLESDGNVGSATLQTRVPAVPDSGELGALVTDVNHMLDALAAYDDRQRQFVADASHELRTPLTTIRGNLEFVRRTPTADPMEREQSLHDASAEADRMALLVNDLLALARAQAQRPPLAAQPVEIDALLVDTFQMARERARAQGIPVEQIMLSRLTPVVVVGDAAQLRQVLLILIDNALKYAPGSLDLRLQRQGQNAMISVRDQGPGISATDLPHIFERFYRTDRARDREGSGLGLAIARTIVRQHGGELRVTSKLGRGSTFIVMLPAQSPT